MSSEDSFEQRLQDHMTEFADRIEIGPSDVSSLNMGNDGDRSGALTVVTAALVLLLAGAGFFLLSRPSDTTEIAAAGEDEQTEGDQARGQAPADSSGLLTIEDVSSNQAPNFGQSDVDGGVYYLLSTAPGEVDLNLRRSEAEWAELHRPDTFYVLDESGQWQSKTVEDRFVSDFAADRGVLYVLSTGTTTGDEGAALGASRDRGDTWEWTSFDDLPDVDQAGLLVNEDRTVIFAGRWRGPAYDDVLAMAQQAEVPVDDLNLLDFDSKGFSYLPIDPDDTCQALLSQFFPEPQYLREMLADATDEEQAIIRSDLEGSVDFMKEEVERTGCDWDPAWETVEGLLELELPDPVQVRWADLGVTVPESWKDWSAVYTFDDGRFTQQEIPFADSGSLWGQVVGDEVQIVVAPEDEDGSPETLWATGDGVNWKQETVDYGDYGPYQGLEYPPVAGPNRFRLGWDEALEQEYEQLVAEAEQAVADGTLSEDEAFVDLEYNAVPLLERSRSGGAWETVTVAELASGVDLDGRVLQDVQGSSLGVFLIFVDQILDEDPLPSGALILHSSNGSDWTSFEVEGGNNTILSGEDSVLLLSHQWIIEPDGESTRTQTLLIERADR